jgi:hypothetical protein
MRRIATRCRGCGYALAVGTQVVRRPKEGPAGVYGVRAQHETIRVVVVAGVRLYREGLVQILSRDPGLLVPIWVAAG